MTPSPKRPKSTEILEDVGSEMKAKPPKIVAQTAQKYGPIRAEKQRRAILLSKARRAGANIPRNPSAGGYKA